MPAESHRCDRLARQVVEGGPEALDGADLDELSRAHLRRCDGCRQVARQVRALHAGLASLREDLLAVPPDAAVEAVEAVQRAETAERSFGRRLGWVAGGLAAAATAGAAGALVFQGHAKRGRLAG